MIRWCPERPASGFSVNVSIKVEPPWDRLSPDYQHGQIPVPGIKGMVSESVTGVMEGLKLIGLVGKRGKINPAYFTGAGRIRPLKEDDDHKEWLLGYSYDGRCINLPTAREHLLIPAYIWTAQNKCHGLIAKLRQMGLKHEEDGEDLWIYDGIEGDQPADFGTLSPASILVAYLRGELEVFKSQPVLQ